MVLLNYHKIKEHLCGLQEFNNISNQVQLEIFEKYFEDLNQQIRVPQADTDYSDRVTNLDEKISIFKTFGNAVYDATTQPATPYFTLPTIDGFGEPITFYRLGTVIYNDEVELQRLQRGDFYYINKSQLTKPSTSWPVYLYENNKLFVKPTDIISKITVDFIRKPKDVIWGFDVGGLGQYIYNDQVFNAATAPTGSIDFEIQDSEQTEVILRILMYAGIVIRDPQIIQAAAQQVQMDEINKKS